MRKVTRSLLLGLALVFAFMLIWQKTRIVILIHADLKQLLLLFGVLALGICLIFEVLLGR
jgi:preprotein translocase subunit SecD